MTYARNAVQLEPVHNMRWVLKQLCRWENIPLYLVLLVTRLWFVWDKNREVHLHPTSAPVFKAMELNFDLHQLSLFLSGCLVGGLLTTFTLKQLDARSNVQPRHKALAVIICSLLVVMLLPSIPAFSVLAIVVALLGRIRNYFRYHDDPSVESQEVYDPHHHRTRLGRDFGMLSWQDIVFQVESLLLGVTGWQFFAKTLPTIINRFFVWHAGQPPVDMKPTTIYLNLALATIGLVIVVINVLWYPLNPWRYTFFDVFLGYNPDLNYVVRIINGRRQPVKLFTLRTMQENPTIPLEERDFSFASLLRYIALVFKVIIIWWLTFIMVPLRHFKK